MKRLVLLAALTAVVSVPLALHAQKSAGFEVAAIRKSDPNTGASPIGPVPRIMPPLGGRFTATNVTVRLLLRMATQLPDFRIVGGPSWVGTERFDIQAKADESFNGNLRDIFPLVLNLLEDRFRLKTHRETRELPIYALVVARGDRRLGAKLKASQSQCGDIYAEIQKRIEEAFKSGNGLAALAAKPGQDVRCSLGPGQASPTTGALALKADGLPMAILAQLLTELTGRVVEDRTGLEGLYDWEFRVSLATLMQLSAGAGVNIPPAMLGALPEGPSLMTELQEELGLKLESTRGPVEVLVIDTVEMPTDD